MTIHHSQIKKAEKMGIQLTEEADIGRIRAFWPKRSVAIYGNSAADAMTQMQAAIAIADGDEFRILTDIGDSRLIDVIDENGMVLKGGPMPPVAAHKLIVIDGRTEWVNPEEGEPAAPFDNAPIAGGEKDSMSGTAQSAGSKVERINGVAVDGKVAYSEGTPAGDCPYSSEGDDDEEYENFERWNAEWDEAADAAEEEEGKTGTVVAEKYRAKYAEAGHPTHCGDWLANTLNGLVLNKGGTNLELLEAIADLNNVSLAKYKREGVGWQGRLRMTARNLMAKKVFLNDGKLMLPQTINGGMMQAPPEWMAEQRYKKPAAK